MAQGIYSSPNRFFHSLHSPYPWLYTFARFWSSDPSCNFIVRFRTLSIFQLQLRNVSEKKSRHFGAAFPSFSCYCFFLLPFFPYSCGKTYLECRITIGVTLVFGGRAYLVQSSHHCWVRYTANKPLYTSAQQCRNNPYKFHLLI